MTGEPKDRYGGVPRALVAQLRRPVDAYVGLTLAEARVLAASESRTVRVGLEGRANLVTNRVRLELDEAGLVVRARAG